LWDKSGPLLVELGQCATRRVSITTAMQCRVQFIDCFPLRTITSLDHPHLENLHTSIQQMHKEQHAGNHNTCIQLKFPYDRYWPHDQDHRRHNYILAVRLQAAWCWRILELHSLVQSVRDNRKIIQQLEHRQWRHVINHSSYDVLLIIMLIMIIASEINK